MNTGIADAFDLATGSPRCPARPGSTALDGYENAGRASALEVLRFTDRMTRIAMLGNPIARLVRRSVAGTVGRLGPVQRRMAGMWVTGLERSPLQDEEILAAVAPVVTKQLSPTQQAGTGAVNGRGTWLS